MPVGGVQDAHEFQVLLSGAPRIWLLSHKALSVGKLSRVGRRLGPSYVLIVRAIGP
jgi:hypothetical protein